MTHDEKRQYLISGLRELADFYERTPEFPTPSEYYRIRIDIFLTGSEARAELTRCAKLLSKEGMVKKDALGSYFYLTRSFGPFLRLDINADREKVCKRIVTGTTVIPAHVVPAIPEHEVPEQTVETVEWNCESILSDPSPSDPNPKDNPDE